MGKIIASEMITLDGFMRDLPKAQIHILNGGHMTLETNFDEVIRRIESFMCSN